MTVTTVSEDFDKPLTREADQSYTMPARYYLDPWVYEQENRQFSSVPGITSGTSRRCATPGTTSPSTLPTRVCS